MNWNFDRRMVLVCLSVMMLIAGSAWAQTGTTSVRGEVLDKSGAAISGAKVSLSNPAVGLTRETQSGSSGDYAFLQLAPGTYSLAVEMAGFRRYEQKNIQLLVNSPITVNVTLEIGVATETVEVYAQAVAINTTDATLGIAFGERQVKDLPLEGRNVAELLSLQSGVVYTGNRTDINQDVDTRNGAVNGARSDQSNITLDGVDVNTSGGYAFQAVLPATLDSVQEFRVTTTNYNADQGGTSGAQVSLVTKSGTNQFHGSAYEYLRNTITSANDFFIKKSQLEGGEPNEPSKLIRNIFGASLGGPFRKDRFYFFMNYEGARQREANAAARVVPTASLRDGVMLYPCAPILDSDGNVVQTPEQVCPGNTVNGASGNPHTAPAGSAALSPSDIKTMDPAAADPNQAMLDYLSTYPLPNDDTLGDGLGYNYSGFRFNAPVQKNYNYYIARADYKLTSSGSHTLFWRGSLSNFLSSGSPFLPGEAPSHTLANFNKGSVVGYTAILRSNLVNNFRWGFTRESIGDNGNSNEQWIYFRGLNTQTGAITRTRSFQRPVHSFSDDLSWVKGKHTFQFGGGLAFIRNPRVSSLGSFSDGATNASWLDKAAIAGQNTYLDPGCRVTANPVCTWNFPAVSGDFDNSYDFPLIALLGIVTEVDAAYNYNRDGKTTLPQGAPVHRRFGADGYEMYAQDSWKIKPNFTLTLGLRYSLFSPPWETNGLQVSPNFSLGKWFSDRGTNMQQGVPSNQDPLISFDLSGPANGGKPGLYKWDKNNFGPRAAFAWSPRPGNNWLKNIFGEGDKSTIRAGFGIVYDRIGGGLLNTFDQAGSFGLSTGLTNPAAVQTLVTAPRLTDVNTIPVFNNNGDKLFLDAPTTGFPQQFPSTLDSGGFAITWGLDDTIRTPYSYALDFSIGRELPHQFSVEFSYVGRLSHKLLTQEDLAMPKDLTDPTSKVDYFSAVTALAKLYRQGVATSDVTAAMVGPTAAYWQNMTQPLNPGGTYSLFCSGGSTTDPIQANYDLFGCFSQNETTALFVLDLFGIEDGTDDPQCGDVGFPQCNFYFPSGGANSYFSPQYSSLYAWRTASNANYHAFQFNLRKHMSHGVQFDFNYTLSKSIDISSDAERIGTWGGLGGQIINSWSPKQQRAVSDYDALHQINANWILELPFGKGKKLAGNSHGVLEAFIGGWQLSGLYRWTTGFPLNVFNGFQWPTNWQLGGNATLTGKVHAGAFTVQSGPQKGAINVFKEGPGPDGAITQFTAPFPGEGGARNQIRGQGFFGIDMGLSKRWKMPWAEGQSLKFRWEVFNITNSVRFDSQSIAPELDISGSFGNYTGLLTQPRVMQFALRYEF